MWLIREVENVESAIMAHQISWKNWNKHTKNIQGKKNNLTKLELFRYGESSAVITQICSLKGGLLIPRVIKI